jgi:hypothetical protein
MLILFKIYVKLQGQGVKNEDANKKVLPQKKYI